MSLSKTTLLESGRCSIERTVAAVLTTLVEMKKRGCVQHLVDVLGVVAPVGSDMQGAAIDQFISDERQEDRLDNSPLVVAFLGPGIRKIKVDTGKRAAGHLVLQNVDCVVTNKPQIVQPGHVCMKHAVPDTGFVYFDAEVVPLAIICRLADQRLTVAKADLQHRIRVASEAIGEIQGCRCVIDAVAWPEFLKGAFLPRCHAAGTPYETSNCSPLAFVCDRFDIGHATYLLDRLAGQHIDLPQILAAHLQERFHRQLAGLANASLEIFHFLKLGFGFLANLTFEATFAHH